MDRIRIGQVFRAIRRERRLRQIDVARRAGIGQQTVSDLERGRFGGMSIDRYCQVAEVLGADIALQPQWRGPKLARLLDRRHARLSGGVADHLSGGGWTVKTEVSFNEYGDRGAADIVGWRVEHGALLIVEIKSELVSLEETMRSIDVKARVLGGFAKRQFGWVVRRTGVLLVLPEGSTSRDAVGRHRALLDACLPTRGIAVRRWLDTPTADMRGILFFRDTGTVGVTLREPTPERIRTRGKVGDRPR
jgi:transcriptional regulator with XRE-family HTH domain